MQIKHAIAQVIKITSVEKLDPVKFFIEDIGKGCGQITITCWGKAWTAYWGGMGQRNMAQFFCSCSAEYLSGKLSDIDSEVVNFHQIAIDTGVRDIEDNTMMLHIDELQAAYGDDWYLGLPKMPNHHYTYLVRIIHAVQEALKLVEELEKE